MGVAVRALASHLCDPGSVPEVGMWVEFVVGSFPAPRVFLPVLRFFSLHKNQHFQIPIRTGFNSIKHLQVSFTSVAIVSEVENNSYTCKLHL